VDWHFDAETAGSIPDISKKQDGDPVIPAHSASMFEDLKAVVHDFADTCAGEHARTFLGAWQGKLLYDDYTGNVAVEDMLP
jgi:hypothetical protein